MSTLPTVSVVTACYNSATTLSEAIASIRSQQGIALDYIIIDGGSSDGSRELVEAEAVAQGTKLKRWISESDGGIYDALNKGIALASGEVLGFLHADDLLANPHVLRQVAQTFLDPDVTACYGDLQYVRRADPTKVVRYWKAGVFRPELLARGWMPPHPTFYVRRDWYVHHGGFNASYRIAADYDLMLRLLREPIGKIAYIPEVLVRMRFGGSSNRSFQNILQKSIEDYRAIKANRVGGIGTLAWKNLRKLPQFLPRRI